MAPAGGCSDCGLVFKHLDPDRDNCFKCEKRNKCGTDAIKLAEVEKLVQCMGCGVAYKYFPAGRTACGSCEAKDDAETGSSKLKQSEAEKENKKIVIDVDDSDSDAGFDGKSELNAKVQRQKDAASRMRLTRKTPEIADSIPTRSREFLDKRENARKRGGDAAKAASILFKVSVVLHKDKGQRQGTRVPSQSRGFSLDDNMQHVFKKLVDMVNERDGPWAQYYPNKTFSLTDVQFTFKDHVGIQPKFNSPDMSVSKFWTLHTQLPGQYFKKASISASTAEIDMLVPIEITYTKISDSDSEDGTMQHKKRRRSGKGSSSKQGSKRVKLEDQSEVAVKGEPTELKLPKTTAVPRRPLRLSLSCPVVFTKERRTALLSAKRNISEEFHGTMDSVMRTSFEMQTHTQLNHDGEHYLARRLEDDSFQFSPDDELNAARAELDRAHQLCKLLEDLEKHGEVTEVQNYSTPDIFIATVTEKGTVIGHLICQPKPEMPLNNIEILNTPMSEAMSHYSYIDGKGCWMLQHFRSIDGSDGKISIFAPISHSESGNSGIFDAGPDGLAQFKGSHACNPFCAQFGLAPF